MAVTYNESFFASVSAKLERMKNIKGSAFRSELSSDIAKIGAQIASAKYNSEDGVAVSAVKGNDGHSAVAAIGSQGAYIEVRVFPEKASRIAAISRRSVFPSRARGNITIQTL